MDRQRWMNGLAIYAWMKKLMNAQINGLIDNRWMDG